MRILSTALALIYFAIPALSSDHVIPDVIRYPKPDMAGVAWVSGHAAFDANGDLRPEYFAPGWLDTLRLTMTKNADGRCHTNFTQPVPLIYTADHSFADLLANATIAIDGKVVASEVGFYGGHPSTLLAIRITRRLREREPLTHQNVIYAAIPAAKVTSPKGALCTDESSQLPTMPKSGDRVLLFSLYPPNDEWHAVFDVHPGRHLLIQPAGKHELIANTLGKEVGVKRTLDDVIGQSRLE